MNADFTHLHLHTQYSLLDGAIRLDPLFKAATEDKMEAVAITDHGNMFGVLDFYHKAKEHGIQPILGCEIYLAPGSRHMKSAPFNANNEVAPYAVSRSGMHHLILLAMNEIGYHNLCKIVSIGYLEGFYYRPRVDKEVLEQYSEGLIATSACLKGEVASQCLMGDMDRARRAAEWYYKIFRGRFYLELQNNGVPQQMVVNQRYQELAEDTGIPLLATADCHYLKKEDAFTQEVLMAIQTGQVIEDPSSHHMVSEEFYFKPQARMKEEFAFCPEAIANTMEITKACQFEFKLKDDKGRQIYHFPKFDPPPGKTLEQMLCENSRVALEERYADLEALRGSTFSSDERKLYAERLEKELTVINEMGFAGYYLIVADFIGYAKRNGIPVGPGRGSGAGSLVAYVLRITDLDPIEHGLLFERFLNPERVSLPDFDVDFCMEKRDKMIRYVTEKYGEECVAQIITFGKLQARGVLRDVGRVLGFAPFEVDKIAKLVPATLNITLKEALEQEPRLRQAQETDARTERLFSISQSLEGLYRHASIHAAGVVIANNPMVEHCPLYRGKEGEAVIQFDMTNAERIGLIKFDFLGLKTLTFLQKAEDLVNQRYPDRHLILNKLPLVDAPTYKLLSKGDTFGIFQLESSGMQDLLRRVQPDQFADIVAISALYRPGPIGSGMLDDYISRKHGETPVVYDFNELEPILKDTYGVIVFQEQVQQIAVSLANYTLGGADLLRRAMGKKKVKEMEKQKETFVSGALTNGHNKEKVEHLFELMAKFAGYGFNKSHSAAYSMVTFQTAYLKTHYPVEFFAALLTVERENTDKITRYIADARKHGIAVLPPDINESETDFTVMSDKQIRFGFGAIKGVGQIAIDEIIEARRKEGPFKDLFDLCARTNNRVVNKRVLEAFVKAGTFDSFGVHRASLFAAIDSALELGASLQKNRDDNQSSFLDLMGEEDNGFAHREVTYPEKPPWNRMEELKLEKDTIGFFVSGHPLDDLEWELKKYTTDSISDLLQRASGKECFVGAQLTAFREILTKRGDRMAFATVEDQLAQIEMVIFSDVYLESEEILKSGEPLWISATLEVGENGHKLILSKKKAKGRILPLRFAYEALAREVHLHVPAERWAGPDGLTCSRNLQKFLQNSPDATGAPLFLHLNLDEKTETVLRLNGSIPINREIIEQIRTDFKEYGSKIEFR
ncbi:MAG: DNA polymerase III subunit alpha [Bdellovibrionaceae bacterium]|nr:DNA polymerase III subunit alpha [Pseudobdellovibrionaceae bacterium]